MISDDRFFSMTKTQRSLSTEERRDQLRKERELLPIWSAKEGLLKLIKENRATVVVGETGSGGVQHAMPMPPGCSTHSLCRPCNHMIATPQARRRRFRSSC